MEALPPEYQHPSIVAALYIVIFLYGVVIGSFLNVVIDRVPRGESIVKVRSHCEACGYTLKWYDLIPIVSFVAYRGKCRKCGARLSPQYPIIEAVNGLIYLTIFAANGFSLESVIYCLVCSALLALSVIDERTHEIPVGFNIFIAVMGMIRVLMNPEDWLLHVIGMVAVSVPLYILYVLSKGRAIGGGDIKLEAAAGLLLGWKNILLGFIISCIFGSIIHSIRMKTARAGRVLAMGPYLAFGIYITMLFGNEIIAWYIRTMF